MSMYCRVYIFPILFLKLKFYGVDNGIMTFGKSEIEYNGKQPVMTYFNVTISKFSKQRGKIIGYKHV
jgi:hypothetical protein